MKMKVLSILLLKNKNKSINNMSVFGLCAAKYSLINFVVKY